MSTRIPAHPAGARRAALGRRAARLGLPALLAVIALGIPEVRSQQAQQPPPAQTTAPQQGASPEAAGPEEAAITERQFKDWMVRCGRPNEQAPEICEMSQQVDAKEGPIMAVAVGQVPGTSDLGLLIVLPLGILLPAGVTLQIDGSGEIPLQVERCERQGCRIERILEPDLLNRLKAGKEAKVFFEAFDPQGERQRLGVPISLLGFTAALNEVAS